MGYCGCKPCYIAYGTAADGNNKRMTIDFKLMNGIKDGLVGLIIFLGFFTTGDYKHINEPAANSVMAYVTAYFRLQFRMNGCHVAVDDK